MTYHPGAESRTRLEVSTLAHGGEGIARSSDGKVCFVPYGLPGDVLSARVEPQSRGIQRAVDLEWETRSPHFAAPGCSHFGKCGGCNWLHFAYPAQAEWKQRIVKDCFSRMASIEVDPGFAENPDLRLGYRTRARFQAEAGRVGFYAVRSNDVVDIESCPLCHPKLNAALNRLRALQPASEVSICVDPEGDDVLVWTDQPMPEIARKFERVNWTGDGRPRESFLFDGVPIVNGAFSQSSLLLNRTLRSVITAAVGQPVSLLDLYCGTGNVSLAIESAKTVVGVDVDGPAIMAAHRLDRGEYRVGDEAAMRQAVAERAWDVVVLDPPRAGARKIVNALEKARTGRIVYVSCDPATLARDAKQLVKAGWRISDLTVVDMFPRTAHIECVCVFSRG